MSIKMTEQEYLDADNEMAGVCLKCKQVVNYGGCEPDACCYECEECGANKVYGIAEALINGFIAIVEETTTA